MRDQVVDFVRRWSGKSENNVGGFAPWLGITGSKFYACHWRFHTCVPFTRTLGRPILVPFYRVRRIEPVPVGVHELVCDDDVLAEAGGRKQGRGPESDRRGPGASLMRDAGQEGTCASLPHPDLIVTASDQDASYSAENCSGPRPQKSQSLLRRGLLLLLLLLLCCAPGKQLLANHRLLFRRQHRENLTLLHASVPIEHRPFLLWG